ncbi:MAG: hypothetical protein COT84_07580 [Chlamydiae bacterium CG10_big_fil_rev_8_21_14_0_10_35_9]|nr:MAG: hypothetical protein COT84_07580 [Chlamydiae bacterium CG10_big_fil_rev_8_21_14_0_10_35_9]
MAVTNQSHKNFLTLKQWLEKYQAIPEGGIRHLIFTNKHNFNQRVVKKLGRKILLDEQAFLNYIDEQSKA